MKLLNCLICHDIVKLQSDWRKCACQKSSARYLKDGISAQIIGECRIIGVDNKDYTKSIKDNRIRSEWFIIREDGNRIQRSK